MGKEQLRQFFSSCCSVLTLELADSECVFILNDILGQVIVFFVPDPGLEGNPLSFARRVNIRGRIRRLAQQQAVIIPDAGDKDTTRSDPTDNTLDSFVGFRENKIDIRSF